MGGRATNREKRLLIAEVHARPALWDDRHQHFKKASITRRLWDEIGAVLHLPGTERARVSIERETHAPHPPRDANPRALMCVAHAQYNILRTYVRFSRVCGSRNQARGKGGRRQAAGRGPVSVWVFFDFRVRSYNVANVLYKYLRNRA